MSVHVLSWVLRYSEERLGNRLVLLVLADHAHEDGTEARPSVATIAREARLSERQVQYALRHLQATGAIEDEGEGPKGVRVYRVTMLPGGAESAPVASDTAPEGVKSIAPEPSLEPPTSTSVANAPSADGARASVLVVARDRPRSVDRKPTTETERDLAYQVLTAWNRAARQDLRSEDWLSKIIMRSREYPEATVADHTLIIETALANPWWTGPASPSVVYGNGAQFERSIAQVRQSQTVSEEIKTALEGMRRSRERRRAG